MNDVNMRIDNGIGYADLAAHFLQNTVRPGKVDLQFIVRAFPKMHAGGRLALLM